jgi:hypothetical protein
MNVNKLSKESHALKEEKKKNSDSRFQNIVEHVS